MSTWYTHVRIEKGTEYAEYDDFFDIYAPSGEKVTPKTVADVVVHHILQQQPHLRGGRVNVIKIRQK
ncbi:hypothetical protein [Streptomyces sp. NPDC101249]|uniref:hypothetical protein n=1 Tax=Streptomyces sp. NPDC101249 TaxID=3366140 RepID=UPI0037F32806